MKLNREILFRLIMAVGAVALLAGEVRSEFFQQNSSGWVFAKQPFGTPWAPYSDALGPWLDGGMSYYLHHVPVKYLYRPTVGIFYGSIFAFTGLIHLIPLFFWGWMFAALFLLILYSPIETSAVLTVWSAITAFTFDPSLKPLIIGSISVDPPAFVLSFLSVTLVAYGLQRKRLPALYLGFTVLGMAAAVRGALLPAIPALLLLAAVRFKKDGTGLKKFLRVPVLCGVLSFSPLLLDFAIQDHYHIINNGMLNLFCFQTDPIHTWTPECKTQYQAQLPSRINVISGYLQFVSSSEGLRALLIPAGQRLALDGRMFGKFPFIAGAILLLLFNVRRRRFGIDRRERALLGTGVFILAVAAVSGSVAPSYAISASVVLILYFLFAGIQCGRWDTAAFLISYVLGVVLIVVLGFALSERVAATFTFLLYLGILSFFAGSSGLPAETGERREARGFGFIVWGSAAVVVFLYTGTWFPTGTRRIYDKEVRDRQAAIKISNDPDIDRSLYYTGSREFYYTLYDPAPVGTVRQYHGLNFKGHYNISFIEPGQFLD